MLNTWTLPRCMAAAAMILLCFCAGQALGYFIPLQFTCPLDCCATGTSAAHYNSTGAIDGICQCNNHCCLGFSNPPCEDCAQDSSCSLIARFIGSIELWWCGCAADGNDPDTGECCVAMIIRDSSTDPWRFQCSDQLDRCTGAEPDCKSTAVPIFAGCRFCFCD